MTQWIEDPEGGRDRGPRAVARAWFEVLTAPRRFFRAGVAPADQAPGLFFLMAVVLVAEGGRYLLIADAAPAVSSLPVAGPVLALSLTVVLVAPVALHLLVALQTVVLMALVPERAGVSETVQVLAYASAPCVLAGVPVPAVRVVCTAYGFVLLVVGLAVVHETSYWRATAAAIPTGAIGLGYGFRGFEAASAILPTASDLLTLGGIA
ncbi:YIP1 family protein [Halapricum hydrolyticum]|uniref:YIP1 family protein n=1 Tax=Halapricum hydrolyticum TaxID=2979991 RepID=A0AAE3IBU2_9EURY|nr:YIP1 family protein [Halapricum hydrolyticum]MCU4719127.1 YIP1 family protein [Halapricum hydrolyticum]MCU4727317.1 YIP1 family protein [Halapricum hydrolyticum]